MTKALVLGLALLGLPLLAGPAFAGDTKPSPSKKEAAPEDKNTGKSTPKPGAACKTDEDCAPSGPGQSCVKSKCEAVVRVHPVT